MNVQKNYRSSVLLSFLLLLVITTLAGCDQAVETQAEPVVRPAKLIEVAVGSNERNVSFPAIIEASASSELTFEVGGTLNELLVTEGQEVQQNDVVARLDQRNYQNELSAAQTQYDAAQTEYARAKRLLKEKAIARSVFEQRRTQRNVARNTLDNARKAFEDTELRAPFAGVIAVIETEQFQNISPGTAIMLLQSTGAAEAVVQIPARLVLNSANIVPLETFVIMDAASDVAIPATVLSTATQADESTQTFEVKFGFNPPENLVILPGMTGTVKGRYRLLDQSDENLVSVPLASIASDGDERFVWKVDTEAMTVSRQNVVIGQGVGESLKIIDGLAAGDTIVGAGMSYLHEGMQIRAYEQ